MTKAKTNTGKTNAGKAGTGKSNIGKAHTGKTNIGKTSTANRAAKSAGMKRASAKSAPSKTTQRRSGAATATHQASSGKAKQQQQGREDAGPGRLRPLRKRESGPAMIAAAANDAGIDRRIGATFNRSLMTRIKRHVMRGGSGYAPIPDLDAALFRGEQAARPARKMFSPLLKREVNIPAKRAQPVPKFRAHSALREAVART